MRALYVAMLAPALLSATPRHVPRPTPLPRIVSINPCLDAILVEVADPAQIAGISAYSQDPRSTSIPLAVARRFTALSGTAEEVVALRPDIVIGGAHVSPATVAALKRMRIPLVQYPVPATVDVSVAQVRALAAVAGHPARGVALARRIAAAAAPARLRPVPALIWGAGGLVPGAGTLPDELLRRAGFSNSSAAYGLAQWDILPLEYLVARPPRVLLSTGLADVGGERLARHRAVRRLGARITVAPFAARLMNCGGPSIIAAMARLRAIRQKVGRQGVGA